MSIYCPGNQETKVFWMWNFFGSYKHRLDVSIEDEVEAIRYSYGFVPYSWKFRRDTDFNVYPFEFYVSVFIKPRKDCYVTETRLGA
jgi:hypothetical protein